MITTLLSLGLSSMICVSPVFAEDINTVAWYDTYVKVPSLGNYEFEIESHEIPSHEVLPIVGKEYFPYSTMKYTTEVDNTAPSAKYKAMPISKVDVVFALGKLNQSEQLMEYMDAVEAKLNTAGNDIDARVEKVETSKVDMQHAFAWKQDVNYRIGNISIGNNGTRVNMTGNDRYPGKNAIWIDSDTSTQRKIFSFDYNVTFGDSFGAAGVMFNIKRNGDYLEGYAIGFSRNSGTCFITPNPMLEWAAVNGQLFATNIKVYREVTWHYDGGKTETGMSWTWLRGTGNSIYGPAGNYINKHPSRWRPNPVALYKIRYRIGQNQYTFWDNAVSGVTAKYGLRTANEQTYTYDNLPDLYKVRITDPEDLAAAKAHGVKIQDTYVQKNSIYTDCPNVQFICGIPAKTSGRLSLEIEPTTIIVSGGGMAEPMQIDLPEEMGTGLGFFSEHYSHSCPDAGSFALSNIELITTNTKTLGEVVQDTYWRDGASRVVIYADDEIPEYLLDAQGDKYQTTLTKLMNNNVYLVGLGTDTNKQIMQDIIQSISTTKETKGTYFDNTPVNQGLDNACDWIIELIKNLAKPEDWILVNTEVLWDTIYKDQEHDLPLNFGEHDGTQKQPQDTSDVELANTWSVALTHLYKSDKVLAEKWRYRHFNNYFDNSTVREGFHSVWIDNPVEIFPNPGLYRINYKRKDNPFHPNADPSYIFDNYRYWSTDYDYKQPTAA